MAEETQPKENVITIKKSNIKMVAIIAIVFIIGLFLGSVLLGGITGRAITQTITPQQAADKAINFINENILAQRNLTASFVSVNEFENLYNVTINIQNNSIPVYVTKDGSYLFLLSQPPIKLSESLPPQPIEQEQPQKTIGDFFISEEEICKEDGKPIIYLFGSNNCPHCRWLHPIITGIAEEFKGYISLHDNMDSDADGDVYSRFGTGYIPLTVLGCKYYRTGTKHEGENNTKAETDEITALICKLTNNQPDSVCSEVQSLISQIP